MKRIIAIPILLIYLVAITGAIINLHYCSGRLFSMKIGSADDCCCKPAAGKSADNAGHYSLQSQDGCCSNTVIAIKIASQQLHVSDYQVATNTGIAPAILPYIHFEYVSAYQNTGRAFIANPVHAPPGLWQDMPLYKLHHRFILYS